MTVVHRPRVAWEAARTFVAAADTRAYYWLSEMLGRHLGVMYELELAETRLRLREADEPHPGGLLRPYAEMGAWRARLEDLLDLRPELTVLVRDLTGETAERLCRP